MQLKPRTIIIAILVIIALPLLKVAFDAKEEAATYDEEVQKDVESSNEVFQAIEKAKEMEKFAEEYDKAIAEREK